MKGVGKKYSQTLLVNLYGEKFRNTKLRKAYIFFDPNVPFLGTYKSKIMHSGGYGVLFPKKIGKK